MKHYILTLSDHFGSVLLLPISAGTLQEAISRGCEIAETGYKGLFVSECREV